MRIGACIEDPAGAATLVGTADFVEIPGRDLVAATAADLERWTDALARFDAAPVCNRLLPYGITLHDTPDARAQRDAYWARLLERGTAVGVTGYCLGAGAARAVPPAGPERDAAIAGVRRVVADLAQRTADAGATLYLEPLRPAECDWLNRAADGALIGPAGVLGLCADVVHLAGEAAADDWSTATAWAAAAHCHVSGPDHGPLVGHEDEAWRFVAAVARGVRVDAVSIEVFGGTAADRRAELGALRLSRGG